MKKVVFTAFFFTLFATGLFAQAEKNSGSLRDSLASNGSPSSAREGKNVGKGSPLLQRQTGSGSGEQSAPAPASKSSAAPTESKTKVAPTQEHSEAKKNNDKGAATTAPKPADKPKE